MLCCFCGPLPGFGRKDSAFSWSTEEFLSCTSAHNCSLNPGGLHRYSVSMDDGGCCSKTLTLLGGKQHCDVHHQLKGSTGCVYGLYIH